jgi:hypothetical protein
MAKSARRPGLRRRFSAASADGRSTRSGDFDAHCGDLGPPGPTVAARACVLSAPPTASGGQPSTPDAGPGRAPHPARTQSGRVRDMGAREPPSRSAAPLRRPSRVGSEPYPRDAYGCGRGGRASVLGEDVRELRIQVEVAVLGARGTAASVRFRNDSRARAGASSSASPSGELRAMHTTPCPWLRDGHTRTSPVPVGRCRPSARRSRANTHSTVSSAPVWKVACTA